MQEKYLTRDQMQEILNTRPKGVPISAAVDMYVKNGWTIQGVNEPKSTKDKLVDNAKGFVKGATTALVTDPIEVAETIGNTILDKVNEGSNALANKAREKMGLAPTETPEALRRENRPSIVPEKVTETLKPDNEDEKLGADVVFYGSLIAPFGPAVLKRGVKAAEVVGNVASKGKKAVQNTVDEALFTPTAEEATKTTLNPFLEKTSDVSLPVKDKETGLIKYVVKPAKDATDQEIQAYKEEVSDLYKDFTEQGKRFLKDRSTKGGSPVEQVGDRIDHFAGEVKKFRQNVGKQMGQIEDKALGVKIAPAKNTIVKAGNIDNYGPDEGLNKEMLKLYKDLGDLENKGATVGETLSFTRKWARFIENQKDKFGDFKDNKFANVNIEKVVNAVKDQARDTLSEADDSYKKLVGQYRLTSKFGEEAKRLLGQEGLYGSTIKGAATAKRAIQSNSDAGARQFLKTLRDITGYDGIKEADVALKAMKDVGDYQGLSLLGILSEVEGGLLNTTKKIAKKVLTPSEKKRTEKYINKDK
jgi:hypothetical protein